MTGVQEQADYKPVIAPMRRWAIRMWIYGMVCDFALAFLYLRYLTEFLDPMAIGERALVAYLIGIGAYLLAIILTFLSDKAGLPSGKYRVAIYVSTGIILCAKLLNAFFQAGIFWVYS